MARVFAQEAFKVCDRQGISTYEMILLAAHRAKILKKLPKDKLVLPAEEYEMKGTSPAVTVLKEIESGDLDVLSLRQDYIESYSTVVENQEIAEED